MSRGSSVREVSSGQPKVWLEMSVNGAVVGVLFVVLRGDLCPKTCENFRGLCSGDYGLASDGRTKLSYQGTSVHRVVPSLGLFAGDLHGRRGFGGESVFKSEGLPDENFALRHTGRGVVSMVGSGGPDTNGSTFMIQLRKGAIPELDGRFVVFGFVVDGFQVLDHLESLFDQDGLPTRSPLDISISRCGQIIGDGTAQAGSMLKLRKTAGREVHGETKGGSGEEGGSGKGGVGDGRSSVVSFSVSKSHLAAATTTTTLSSSSPLPSSSSSASSSPTPSALVSAEIGEEKVVRGAPVSSRKEALDRALLAAATATPFATTPPAESQRKIPLTQVLAAMRRNPDTPLSRAFSRMHSPTSTTTTTTPTTPTTTSTPSTTPISMPSGWRGTRRERVRLSELVGVEGKEAGGGGGGGLEAVGSVVSHSFAAKSKEGAVALARLGGEGHTLKALARRVRGPERSKGDPTRKTAATINQERRQRLLKATASSASLMAAAGAAALSRIGKE